MDKQAEAERHKRAEILDSEGRRQSAINSAEGERQSTVLAAEGEAQAILARARATAAAVEMIASATRKSGGTDAIALRIAEQYIAAFSNIAKTGNTLLLPADTGNVSSMVSQALSVYKTVSGNATSRDEGKEDPMNAEELYEKTLDAIKSSGKLQ